MACHIQKRRQVEVIAGDHKGQRGKVLKVHPEEGPGAGAGHQHGVPARAAQPAEPAGRAASEGSPDPHLQRAARATRRPAAARASASRCERDAERQGDRPSIACQLRRVLGLSEVTRETRRKR